MGNAGSSAQFVPTAPITINRIRTVCQRTKDLEKNRWEVDLLANDISKVMGVDIPIVDSSGKKKSVGKVCEKIRTMLPNPSKVCMASNNKSAKGRKGVLKAVELYNSNFGANIQVLRNPLYPEQGERPIDDLCDDLYYVSDKVMRNLKDNHAMVKQSLEEEIQRLMVQYGMLQNMFSNLKTLPGNTDETIGQMEDAMAVQQAFKTSIEGDLAALQEQRVKWAALANSISPAVKAAHHAAMTYPAVRTAMAPDSSYVPDDTELLASESYGNMDKALAASMSGGSVGYNLHNNDPLSADVANESMNFTAQAALAANKIINGCEDLSRALDMNETRRQQYFQEANLRNQMMVRQLFENNTNVETNKIAEKMINDHRARQKAVDSISKDSPNSNEYKNAVRNMIARQVGCDFFKTNDYCPDQVCQWNGNSCQSKN